MKLNCLIVLCQIICCCPLARDKKIQSNVRMAATDVVVVVIVVVTYTDAVVVAVTFTDARVVLIIVVVVVTHTDAGGVGSTKDVICSETFVSNVLPLRVFGSV